ncbi:MAG: type VI secretion system protein TssA [Gemmatimonadota bacterium]
MPARDELLSPLLAPIPGDNPSGRPVRDDPIYEKIKEARREDDDADQGAWQRARKVADHGAVVKLTAEVLSTTSKDLQLASWWTESMLKREGLPGLRDGVALMRGLLENFWDTVYPEIEDGDPSMRAGPLDFIGIKLVETVRSAPLSNAKHNFRQYDAAALVGSEDELREDELRREARDAFAAKGEPVIETIWAGVDATPKQWYVDLSQTIRETTADLYALDEFGNEHFVEEAPSYRRLLDVLEAVQRSTDALLARRRLQEPEDDGSGGEADGEAAGVAGASGLVTASVGAIPTSEADAGARVVVAARFLRRANPLEPAPYALMRALRWRALGPADPETNAPAAARLHAPPTSERARLKGFLLEERHEDLLDGVEELMGSTSGGAWLDAQRWALDSAQALGDAYAPVVHMMRSALRQLLADYPGLPHAMLLDDTPVANAETLAWLDRAGLLGGSQRSVERPPLDGMPSAPHRPMLERARAEVSGGRLDRGVALLMADVVRERSERARFLRRLELVTVLVDAKRSDIAMPIVEELLDQVESHKLDSWEDGGVVAQAMVLACRAIDATDGSSSRRSELYLRICRLDPIAALALGGS